MDIAILEKVESLGVGFCIPVPTVGGWETYLASPEDVILFASDPDALYAKAHGVSKADYLAWRDNEYSVHCGARTRSGKPCKNVVAGGCSVSAKEWIKLHGSSYCTVHEEGAFR